MYACLLAVAAALFGQVAGGDRYPAEPSAAAPLPKAAAPSTIGQPATSPQTSQPELSIVEPSAKPTPAEGATGKTPPATPVAEPPAAAAQPGAPVTPGPAPVAAVPRPSELIRDWAKAPVRDQLPGMPTTLGEALRDAKTRTEQTERTKAYWDLSARVTDYYLALLDATELETLRRGIVTPGEAWDSQRRTLDTALQLARKSAKTAQLRLQQTLGRSTTAALPLPADLPHCGKYDTRYDEIFAGRSDAAAAQLKELLPLKYDEMRTQARLVSEAYTWLDQVSQRREPNSDGTGLLRAHELLSLQRRALVESVREYNQDIVAYTELAAPSDVGTERLVAMLIRASTTSEGWREPTGVLPASATEDAKSAGQTAGAEQDPSTPTEAARPRTYAGQGRTEVRRPAFWRLRNREHSIVVDRLFPRLRSDRD